jgi:hypothetical protein
VTLISRDAHQPHRCQRTFLSFATFELETATMHSLLDSLKRKRTKTHAILAQAK